MQKLSELLDNICHSEADRVKAFLLLKHMQKDGLLNFSIIENTNVDIDRLELNLSTSNTKSQTSTFH